jgi:hypothetical protein
MPQRGIVRLTGSNCVKGFIFGPRPQGLAPVMSAKISTSEKRL